ncbi:polysaccharide pyruvyl transferase family protein [Rhodovulum sp. YEN HP10]|uniref:polysaccharide pyruvyl transferase family protein n=1 Tax=Rhodovulum sp. HP10 TaxID=3387397 RepID=UPI0039E061EF
MGKTGKAADLLNFLANPRKDIEIFGMFGPGNLGDEAMLVAALDSLPRTRCTPWQSYPNRPLLNRLIRDRRHRDLLVGGGTLIHGGRTGWLDYVEMRSRQGARVSFFGTGMAFTDAQIAGESEAFRRWRAVLERSQEVHLRGPQSVALCRHMGVQADIFGDFAFLLHRPDIPLRDHGARRDAIGLNVGNCLGDQAAYEEACIALVRHLQSRHRLVFYVVVDTDMAATRRVIERAALPEAGFSIERHYVDPYGFMHSVRNLRAFIGLKLHAAGLAMIAGVPALMIAYQPKSRDFMAPLGKTDHLLIDLPVEAGELLSKAADVLERPEDFLVEDRIASIAAAQREKLEAVYMAG